jgi:hydrogenase-1 operon protein HyaE
MTHPLLEALTERHGLPRMAEADLDQVLETDRHTLLFLAGDPVKYPEALDVAVILPELVKVFAGHLKPAVIAAEAEPALQARFGFSQWPALVLLRGEDYVGAITRVRNWADYLAEIECLLRAQPARTPAAGIPITVQPTGDNQRRRAG